MTAHEDQRSTALNEDFLLDAPVGVGPVVVVTPTSSPNLRAGR